MKYSSLAILAVALLLASPVWAEGSSAKVKAKMSRSVAASYQQGDAESMQSDRKLTKGAKCGVNVGTVTVQKGAKAPREVNTMVKGDVISVCK